MPLKLNVGLIKKVGLPNYSSLGASCQLEIELDSRLLEDHPEGFQERARQAFAACEQSVEEELSRRSKDRSAEVEGEADGNGVLANGQGHVLPPGAVRPVNERRPATEAQIRALQSIAVRWQLDLARELQSRLGMERLEELSVREASRLIDELNQFGHDHCRH